MATGFGRDTWCTDTLSPGRYVTGKLLLAQAIYRRLITPRGTLRGSDDAARYGFDVSAYVGVVGEDAVNVLPAQVVSEILKDDRVLNATCRATVSTDRNGLVSVLLEIEVEPADETEDFTLTLSVSEATTKLVSMS